MHGLIFETSVWLLAESTRLLLSVVACSRPTNNFTRIVTFATTPVSLIWINVQKLKFNFPFVFRMHLSKHIFQKLCESNLSGTLRSVHQCCFCRIVYHQNNLGHGKLCKRNFHPSCLFLCRAYRYTTIFPSYVIALCITHTLLDSSHFSKYHLIAGLYHSTRILSMRLKSSAGINQVLSYHGSTVCVQLIEISYITMYHRFCPCEWS